MTDYQYELHRLNAEIDASAASTPSGLLSPESGDRVRHLRLQFLRLSLTGELKPLTALGAELDSAVEAAIALRHHASDLLLLKACLCARLHRFQDAESALLRDPALYDSVHGWLIRSDLCLQQAGYGEARSLIQRALDSGPAWDALARLAHLTALTAQPGSAELARADQIYCESQDELTSKEMRTYCWLELQRGLTLFQRGAHAQALIHYRRADAAYSGYWLVHERVAELDGAQGRFDSAIAAYTRLHAESPRPDWAHAIGDLYSLSGQPVQAELWKQQAFEEYQASVHRGEVHYSHLLSDLCCELAGRGNEAVHYARLDLHVRRNHTTLGDLAWALYRIGSLDEALMHLEQALALKIVCARLAFQAACIYDAAGQTALSHEYMQSSLAANPSPPRARMKTSHIAVYV